MLLDHCNPSLSLRTMTHVILMVREEVNLLHERGPQLALANKGTGEAGVSSSTVGYGTGRTEGCSEGCGVSPGGMLCLVPAGDRPAKVVSTDLRLLFSPQPLGFRVNTFCN